MKQPGLHQKGYEKKKTDLCFFFFPLPSSGSHIENWHSVLRNGLVNASYTKLQVHNLHAERCLCSLTANLPREGRRRRAVRPNHFFFSEWMTVSLLSALLLAFLQSRARWENFIFIFFFTLDSMSLPVTGLEVGGGWRGSVGCPEGELPRAHRGG